MFGTFIVIKFLTFFKRQSPNIPLKETLMVHKIGLLSGYELFMEDKKQLVKNVYIGISKKLDGSSTLLQSKLPCESY